MKLKALVVAVSLPLVAAIVAVTVPSRRDPSTQQATDGPAGSSELTPPESPDSGLPPGWLTAPLPDPFAPDSGPNGAGSANNDLPSAADKKAMVTKVLVNILEEDGVSPYVLDPSFGTDLDALGSHPALPGMSGFEILDCPPGSDCPSERLVEESDDPAWARPMEARVMQALARHSNGGFAQEYVVCRRTVCGIVLPTVPGADLINTYELGKKLVEDLGFERSSSRFVAPGEHFQTIFLERAKEP